MAFDDLATVQERPSDPIPREVPADPVSARGIALTVLAVAALIVLARYMKDVLIPFVLAGLVFYAMDPFVDRLQRLRVPRTIGAAFAIAVVVGASGFVVYTLQDDALQVVDELPAAAERIRQRWGTRTDRGDPPTALEKVQEAARELEKTAAASNPAPLAAPGVERVQIQEPAFRAGDYVWWSSIGAVALVVQATLVLFLAYFLLVYDDLFKRKLVENVGPRLAHKKLTVQILNDIASQIERFLIIQVFTSVLVGMATGLGLWWMGLRHPWVWGVAAGVLNVVPYFGPLIVATGLGIVGFLQFESVSAALGVMALSFLITTVEGYWLTPALMGESPR